MHNAHAQAASIGGIRAGGDLVARMQMTRGMRLKEAKQYVADKLGVSVFDLSDSTTMRTVREELDIGVVTAVPGLAKGLEAKARIADLLGIRINSVERLKAKSGLVSPADRAAAPKERA